MFQANGKKVGGYSLESYEPTDNLEEEKNQSYNFIKTAFSNKLYSMNNYNLNYNYPTPVLNNKKVNTTIDHIPTLGNPNIIQKTIIYNKLNNSYQYPSISNMKLSRPTIAKYSNKTKIVYPSQTLIINNNNNIIPKINYIKTNIPEIIHRRKISSFTPSINPPFIDNNIGNNYLMPIKQPQIKRIAMPKYIMTERMSPIYPTLTYRRRIIY